MAGESREVKPETRQRLSAPPRTEVRVPGQTAPFGPGFRRRLRDSETGCLLILVALFGLGLALYGLAGTAGPFRAALSEKSAPELFLVAMGFGAVFFLVPLRMLQVKLIAAEHKETRRRRRPSAAHPWTTDHPWRPEGMDPDYGADPGGAVLGYVAILSFIALFNLALGSASSLFRGVVLLFDAFGLLLVADALLKLWQAARRLGPRMRWLSFPAFLGGRLEAVFLLRRALLPRGPVLATLRCVRDEEVEHEDSEDGSVSMVVRPTVLYSRTLEVPAGDGPLGELPLAFDLPTDLPGTDLGRKLAIYWQVMIQVPVTGPDVDAVFLAPVYARRGSSTARR